MSGRRTARIPLVIAALVALVGVVASPARADFTAGYVAFQAGDFKEARAELTPLAEAGDKRAQYLLGFMYRDGLGVKKSAARAFEWLSKAAAEPHPDRFALHDLAVLYERGQGTKKNLKKAVELYRQAAARGLPSSMVNLAVLLAKGGGGVERDTATALRLLFRASEAGHAGAAAAFERLAKSARGEPAATGRWRAVEYLAPADDPGLRDIESVAALALGSDLQVDKGRFSFGRLSCSRPVYLKDRVAAATLASGLTGATAVPKLAALAEDAKAGTLPTIEVVCDRVLRASLVVLPDGRLLAPAFGGYLVMEPRPSERVKEAQRLLRAAGFDAGSPDGIYGQRTVEAIRRFQASAGVAATGALSQELFDLLRAAAPQ